MPGGRLQVDNATIGESFAKINSLGLIITPCFVVYQWDHNDHRHRFGPDGFTCLDKFAAQEVSAGEYHTCGVEEGGMIRCWGNDEYGQSSPPKGAFLRISAGGYHTCGVETDNTLLCWGDDRYGQSTQPPENFISASASSRHTCGVRTDNTVSCWGYPSR